MAQLRYMDDLLHSAEGLRRQSTRSAAEELERLVHYCSACELDWQESGMAAPLYAHVDDVFWLAIQSFQCLLPAHCDSSGLVVRADYCCGGVDACCI